MSDSRPETLLVLIKKLSNMNGVFGCFINNPMFIVNAS